jgi:hypothetical protein
MGRGIKRLWERLANRELEAGEATAGGCEQDVGLDRNCPQSDVEAAKNLWAVKVVHAG